MLEGTVIHTIKKNKPTSSVPPMLRAIIMARQQDDHRQQQQYYSSQYTPPLEGEVEEQQTRLTISSPQNEMHSQLLNIQHEDKSPLSPGSISNNNHTTTSPTTNMHYQYYHNHDSASGKITLPGIQSILNCDELFTSSEHSYRRHLYESYQSVHQHHVHLNRNDFSSVPHNDHNCAGRYDTPGDNYQHQQRIQNRHNREQVTTVSYQTSITRDASQREELSLSDAHSTPFVSTIAKTRETKQSQQQLETISSKKQGEALLTHFKVHPTPTSSTTSKRDTEKKKRSGPKEDETFTATSNPRKRKMKYQDIISYNNKFFQDSYDKKKKRLRETSHEYRDRILFNQESNNNDSDSPKRSNSSSEE